MKSLNSIKCLDPWTLISATQRQSLGLYHGFLWHLEGGLEGVSLYVGRLSH